MFFVLSSCQFTFLSEKKRNIVQCCHQNCLSLFANEELFADMHACSKQNMKKKIKCSSGGHWRGKSVHSCRRMRIYFFLSLRGPSVNINLISRSQEITGDYFPSLHIDQGTAEVNMARKIVKPVFSRPREIRVLSQEEHLAHHCLFTRKAQKRKLCVCA